MREIYRLLRYLGDGKALSRGPGAYARRHARRTGHRQTNRALRRVLRP